MKTGNMHDLNFDQLDDGTIRLEQADYCGEASIIDLHPCQLRHVAESVGLLEPVAPTKARWPRGFARRMERLRAQAHDLWAFLDSVPCFPPRQEETEDVIAAGELLDAIDDVLADFDITADDVGAKPIAPEGPPGITSVCEKPAPSAGEDKRSQGLSGAGNEPSELRLF